MRRLSFCTNLENNVFDVVRSRSMIRSSIRVLLKYTQRTGLTKLNGPVVKIEACYHPCNEQFDIDSKRNEEYTGKWRQQRRNMRPPRYTHVLPYITVFLFHLCSRFFCFSSTALATARYLLALLRCAPPTSSTKFIWISFTIADSSAFHGQRASNRAPLRTPPLKAGKLPKTFSVGWLFHSTGKLASHTGNAHNDPNTSPNQESLH